MEVQFIFSVVLGNSRNRSLSGLNIWTFTSRLALTHGSVWVLMDVKTPDADLS